MHIARIYQSCPLTVQQTLILDEKKSHHLLHVLRVKPGTPLVLFNGQGGEYEAIVANIQKRTIEVTLLQYIAQTKESPLHLHLGQGISRGDRMDMTLQKSVELGVSEITPLFTEYSQFKRNAGLWEKKQEHWQAIITHACEQSGRNTIPLLHAPVLLDTWLKNLTVDLALVLNPHQGHSLKSIACSATNIALLIGAESGLSEQEMTQATHYAFKAIQLGPRILRTETAALTAIAAIQTLWGDF